MRHPVFFRRNVNGTLPGLDFLRQSLWPCGTLPAISTTGLSGRLSTPGRRRLPASGSVRHPVPGQSRYSTQTWNLRLCRRSAICPGKHRTHFRIRIVRELFGFAVRQHLHVDLTRAVEVEDPRTNVMIRPSGERDGLATESENFVNWTHWSRPGSWAGPRSQSAAPTARRAKTPAPVAASCQ